MEVETLAKEFYLLQMVELEANTQPFIRSNERWLRNFHYYKNFFNEKLSSALFDYTVLAVYGELRHGANKAQSYNPHVNQGGSRNSSYGQAMAFEPISICKAGVSAFKVDWISHYGGEKWRLIAETGLFYKKIPVECYIDHCVDLQHNSGSFLNKMESNIFIVSSDYNLKTYLNVKKESSREVILYHYPHCSKVLKTLINCAINLQILNADWKIDFLSDEGTFGKLYNYNPIQWGDEILPNELLNSNFYSSDNDSDDYDNYNDNNYEECEGDVYEQEEEIFYESENKARV